MNTERGPRRGPPAYLSLPIFQDLADKLESCDYGMGYTPTHLVVGDTKVLHDECEARPERVVQNLKMLYVHEFGTRQQQDRTGGRPYPWPFSSRTIGLPGWEFTQGGQHISERSG